MERQIVAAEGEVSACFDSTRGGRRELSHSTSFAAVYLQRDADARVLLFARMPQTLLEGAHLAEEGQNLVRTQEEETGGPLAQFTRSTN